MVPLHNQGAPRPVTAAAPAQHQSSGQAEAGRGITEIHGQADLVLHPAGEEGVVEVHDDIIGGPGHCDQTEQASTEKTDSPT